MNTNMLKQKLCKLGQRLTSFSMLAVLATAVTGTSSAAPGEVLILDGTVSGGASSREALAAVAAGKVPVVVSAAQWLAMSAADFASFDALVLGDPTCTTSLGGVQAAIDTASIWGPVVNGNVIIIGTDPVYHFASRVGAEKLVNQGMLFAVGKPGKTGGYLDLSCYYHNSVSGTPITILDGINGGGFTVLGAAYVPGLNDCHIVASHPALVGITNADLSNWGNSVHAGVMTWPVQFEVLAIAADASGPILAPDGTRGYPYILARGDEVVVISDVVLEPRNATNPIGTNHTVTATVTEGGLPKARVDVAFQIIAGPHAGLMGNAVTDPSGQCFFAYTGNAVGIDYIEASFVDSLGRPQRSNRAIKEWTNPVCDPPIITSTPAANRGYYKLTGNSRCYPATSLQIYVRDTGSPFVAGPYPSDTIVRVKKSFVTGVGAGFGPASVTIQVRGNGQAYAVDPDARPSMPVTLRSF
ncbi:MAG: hypothetical protein NTW21_24085 [Verrucomicrobia bacterium]|nr:hypothetical protein [Verrucomicrobiota bacterium]